MEMPLNDGLTTTADVVTASLMALLSGNVIKVKNRCENKLFTQDSFFFARFKRFNNFFSTRAHCSYSTTAAISQYSHIKVI
jgi:hypothetical protein